MHHNVRETVVILDEGSHPLTHCPKFDMFVTWRSLYDKHQYTDMCTRGEEWKRKQQREEEVKRIIELAFQAYRRPLVAVL